MATLSVRITPRAGIETLDGLTPDGQLRVRVRAAPADGAANTALIRLLARTLDVPPSSISIRRGAAARVKQVEIDGLDEAGLAARVQRAIAGS